MNVDERLRESLDRRAASVEPSAAGWTAITRRIERRQRRTHTVRLSLVAGMSLAAVALAVTVLTVTPEDAQQNVAAGGRDPAHLTSTTISPFVDPGAPGAGPPVTGATPTVPGQDPDEPGADPVSPGITSLAPRPGSGPASPGMSSTGFPTGTIWPETAFELESVQAAVDEGSQPWRLDPEQVAARYLDDRGLPTSGTGTPRALGEAGVLRYTSGGVGGWVFVNQLNLGGEPGPDGIYYVTGSRSDRIVGLYVGRRGDRLGVDVTSSAPGRVVVRTKRPGSEWNASTTRTVAAGDSVTLDVDGPAGTDLIVQVRHEGADGKVAINDQLLGAIQQSLDYAALDTGSFLEATNLGPVYIGMSLTHAERFAGIAMVRDGGGGAACTRLSPAGRPEGVEFIASIGSDAVDVIIVDAPGVRTARDIGVGSTVDEVRHAYDGLEERLIDGSGRLVHTPENATTTGYEMFFQITDGEVVAIWSGKAGIANTDELCA